MPNSFLHYILVYGYLAIFLIVFFQEIGIPNPIPNEISLIFFGYLAYQGEVRLPIVLFTALSAELSGTGLVYLVSYFLGPLLARKKLKWLPIPRQKIKTLKERIRRRGGWGIFIGRMTPFIRGYTSVLAGLLQIHPRKYFLIVTASACCSTGGLVLAGWFLGPYWKLFSGRFQHAWTFFLFVAALVFLLRVIPFVIKIINQKMSIQA